MMHDPHIDPSCESRSCRACATVEQSLWVDLPTEVQDTVGESRFDIRLNRGDELYREGQYGTNLFCVHGGAIKLSKIGHLGREVILRFVVPGEVLGYQALITNQPFSHSAVAIEDNVSVCCIPWKTVMELMRHSPALAMRFLEQMSHEVEKAEHTMLSLAQKPVKARLAETLLLLKQCYGVRDGGWIAVDLTREELSNVIGSAPEVVIRLLTSMKKEGLIDTSGRHIALLNERAIVATAEVDS